MKKVILWTVLAAILGCILLAAFAPLISVAIAGEIANRNGCALDEGSIHPCVINGVDYGEDLYAMGVMGWFMLVTVPLGLLVAAVYILIVVIAAFVIAYNKKKKAAAAV